MVDLKVPPHDSAAETSLLGALLLDKELLIDIAQFLRPEHFYQSHNRAIFEAMLALFEHNEPIDLVTVSDELKKSKKLETIGGSAYLSELLETVPTAAHVGKYAKIIHEQFVKRQLISSAAKITESALSDTDDIKEIIDLAEQTIFTVAQDQMHQDFVPLKDALASSFDRLDELHKQSGGLRGVPTGFTDLDHKLAGMQKANLLILAARPGQGKTAFVLNIAQHVSMTDKMPVGFFSLEMSKEELVDRLLVAQSDIDAWRLKTGKLSDDDFTRLSEAMGTLAESELYIDDTPGLSIMDIRTKARRLQAQKGLKLLIVDYLQLITAGKRFESRVQEVSYISQNLKNLARELRIPVLAVSQLSRAVESRGTKIPQLADLRESGAIEQDADVVMFLYRDEAEPDRWETQILTKLLIAKHRNGPVGQLDFIFRGDRVKFFGMEKKQTEK